MIEISSQRPSLVFLAAGPFALLVAAEVFGLYGFTFWMVAVQACLGVGALALLKHVGRSPADSTLWLVTGLIVLEVLLVFSFGKSLVSGRAVQMMLIHLAGWQFVWALASIVFTVLERKELSRVPFRILGGVTVMIAAAAAGFVGMMMGMGHGRPLRIRGRQVVPNLKRGSDWTSGERPDPATLDLATRSALEALWLNDAQTEHASVPAFSRVAWLLAAVGAPGELLAWAHRAALEEIDHAQRCFALAAGYAGRSFTVAPMPELLRCNYGDIEDALVTLAVESLLDGGQLEGFNADIAARSLAACKEPVARDVLERIAREERSHAEFSWAVLAWTLQQDRARVLPAIERTLARLDAYPRPTAVSAQHLALVERADAAALRDHGRLPDGEWAEAWSERSAQTKLRALALVRAVARAA